MYPRLMMDRHPAHISHWLLPLSWLYGWGVSLRNKFFDWGWFRSRSFPIPVICVGNLAVGGTGKTPHTEYLIELLLQYGLQPAVLSRGYKRKKKGYILATSQSTARQIGDEPYQMKQKYPDIQVAVDANRCHGIEQLMQLKTAAPDVILLDDAFQHRYVNAGLNILLTDYQRLLCNDRLLPAGYLREPVSGKNRAHIVIVTKCPADIKPIDFNIITKQLHLYPYQKLYFTRICYGELKPLYPDKAIDLPPVNERDALVLTGIASPAPLIEQARTLATHIESLTFDDHHDFTAKELAAVRERLIQPGSRRRFIITTEKDAARLEGHAALDAILAAHLYVLPIRISFLQEQQSLFNQNIIDYVRTNPRDSLLSER